MGLAALGIGRDTSDEELRDLASEFETREPKNVLRWTLEEFGNDVALATGFGAEGCVLVHMLSQINRDARIFYLDTDLLFPETYDLRDQLEVRYGVRFERRSTILSVEDQSRQFGERLWERKP